MRTLELAYEACVRSLAVAASCTTCKDACPTGAITLDGRRGSVVVHKSRCIDCGLCAAACPTDAFEAPFDVATFVASAPAELRCGQGGLPCIGALSAEDLVAVALAHREITVFDGGCRARDPGHAHAEARVREAQAFLRALGSRSKVAWRPAEGLAPAAAAAPAVEPPAPAKEEAVSAGRRRLLRMLVPPLEERPSDRIRAPDRLDRAKMQQAPERRRRLLQALPASAEAREDTLPEAEIGFFSSKALDAKTCTACSMCVSLCPTGALQAPRSLREIRFDTSRCTKCRLCHDVCEPDALTVAPRTSVEDFLDFAPRMLSRLPVAPCAECGASFTRHDPDQSLCPRCADLDAEARELSGV